MLFCSFILSFQHFLHPYLNFLNLHLLKYIQTYYPIISWITKNQLTDGNETKIVQTFPQVL